MHLAQPIALGRNNRDGRQVDVGGIQVTIREQAESKFPRWLDTHVIGEY
jgi:hypothetical protein